VISVLLALARDPRQFPRDFVGPCRWEEGDLSEWSAVTYPDKLLEYVEAEFKKIKRKQAVLLGIRLNEEGHVTQSKL
jgi:hypothetical protein